MNKIKEYDIHKILRAYLSGKADLFNATTQLQALIDKEKVKK